MSGYLNCDMSRAFARLDQPMVLVWGKQDISTPVTKALALMDLNPRARLEVFDFCRVMPEQEHPEKFNALTREFFRTQMYTDRRDVLGYTKYRAAGE
jgi:pimeloyl-ACP methyl ester carboxylesterase